MRPNADNEGLRYKYLNEFDRAMNLTEEKYGWLNRFARAYHHNPLHTSTFYFLFPSTVDRVM